MSGDVKCEACEILVDPASDGAKLDDAFTWGVVCCLVGVERCGAISLCGMHASHIRASLAAFGYTLGLEPVPQHLTGDVPS